MYRNIFSLITFLLSHAFQKSFCIKCMCNQRIKSISHVNEQSIQFLITGSVMVGQVYQRRKWSRGWVSAGTRAAWSLRPHTSAILDFRISVSGFVLISHKLLGFDYKACTLWERLSWRLIRSLLRFLLLVQASPRDVQRQHGVPASPRPGTKTPASNIQLLPAQ